MSAGFRLPAVLAGLVAALLGFGCEQRDDEIEQALNRLDAARARGVDRPLDPTPYREPLEAFERILYVKRSPEAGDYDELAALLSAVIDEMSRSEASPTARRHGGKLLFFSARLSAQGPDGYSDAARELIRGEWEELRASVFARAAWFGAAPGDALGGPLAGAAGELDGVLADLQVQIDAARGELVTFDGATAIDRELAGGADPGRRLAQWARAWDRRFRDTLGRLPARPDSEDDVDLQLAYQSVDLALAQLDGLDGSRVWTEKSRPRIQRHLDTAAFALAVARRYLRSGGEPT